MKCVSLWFFLLGSIHSCEVFGGEYAITKERPITLVANDWCPQHCLGVELKGYVIDIVEGALKAEGVPYEISYEPWLRALREVDLGKKDGLLTPTVPGFPQFIFHEEPVGFQEYCFFSQRQTDWTFRTQSDLLGKRLAYLEESGLGPLDDFIAAHRHQISIARFASNESNYPRRLFQFLSHNRTDLVIITSDVYEFSLQRKIIPNEFRYAGCLGKEKLAVGLSRVNERRSRQIGSILDRGISKLRKNGQLQDILRKYGLKDWKKP